MTIPPVTIRSEDPVKDALSLVTRELLSHMTSHTSSQATISTLSLGSDSQIQLFYRMYAQPKLRNVFIRPGWE